MSGGRDALVALARESCARAYAPYSGVHVGAALRSASGKVYCGTNVENASYPLGNCAEASAIATGVAAEGERLRIAEIAVWAIDGTGAALAASPCGGCRQRIRELAVDGSVCIHFPWRGGTQMTTTLDELLPYAFSLNTALE
jgi:cytidine deaminase